MFHGLLNRCVCASFEYDGSDSEASEDDQDGNVFHTIVNRRVRKAVELCQDAASNTTTFAIALWATEPLDTLSRALQLLDCDKNSVQELRYTCGLLQTCQKRLWQVATGSEEPEIPLSMLVQQLSCCPGCNQCEVQEEARNKAMFLSGFVWARFEAVVQSPPLELDADCGPARFGVRAAEEAASVP